MTRYFLFAGEVSADLHGSRLMQALRKSHKEVSFLGVGGPRMREEGIECILPMEDFQVMGFSAVLKALPHLLKSFYKLKNFILKSPIDCVVLIDYPGFNLRLAKALRKRGFQGKIVQYICPTVWAHGKKRIFTLERYYDLILSIFPFEILYFEKTSVKIEYIGNPLVETIKNHLYRENWPSLRRLPPSKEIIALFPGSRKEEIERHVPLQLQAAAQLKKRDPNLCFVLSCAHERLKENLLNLIEKSPFKLGKDLYLISPEDHYELMKCCKTALAKSGTVTLELALHKVPTVVHYELSWLNYLIAKYFLRLRSPHYCIVNILGKKTIFPEFMGHGISFEKLSKKLEHLHFDSHHRKEIQKQCEEIKEILENKLSHQEAAKAIKEVLSC